MPKMKTHSGCKKRFRRTANGHIKRGSAYRRHHGWAVSSGKSLDLRGTKYVSEADKSRFAVLLPK